MDSKSMARPGPTACEGARRGGFTLVELLVVIGIIALLVSILLPVLGAARRRAQAVVCASNVRQIYMGMAMFAQDNKGHLPRPYLVNDLSSNLNIRKVCAWAQTKTSAIGSVDMDDDMGLLWKYIKGKEARIKVMMCPGDDGEAPWGWGPGVVGYPRNVSYSLNQWILRDASKLGIVLSTVKDPAGKIMVYEELAPNDAYCIMGPADATADIPSGRHGTNMRDAFRANQATPEYLSKGRGNFCFFDGHVASMMPAELIQPKGRWQYHTPLVSGDPTGW